MILPLLSLRDTGGSAIAREIELAGKACRRRRPLQAAPVGVDDRVRRRLGGQRAVAEELVEEARLLGRLGRELLAGLGGRAPVRRDGPQAKARPRSCSPAGTGHGAREETARGDSWNAAAVVAARRAAAGGDRRPDAHAPRRAGDAPMATAGPAPARQRGLARLARDRHDGYAAASRARSPGRTRGAMPATRWAIARMCSGVVPQQPPMMLTKPLRAKSSANAAVSAGTSS